MTAHSKDLFAATAVVVAFGAIATIHTVRVQTAESHYQLVEKNGPNSHLASQSGVRRPAWM